MAQKFGRVKFVDKFQVWRPPLPEQFLSDAAPQWEGLGRIKRICKVCKIQIQILGKPFKTFLRHSKVATSCFNIWGPSKKSSFCSPKFHGQICDMYYMLFYILHFLLQSFGLLTSYHSVFFQLEKLYINRVNILFFGKTGENFFVEKNHNHESAGWNCGGEGGNPLFSCMHLTAIWGPGQGGVVQKCFDAIVIIDLYLFRMRLF